jgi:predicted ferric reductase
MMALALNGKTSWYIARSGGMIAWVLATASIMWGLALSTRLIKKRGAPAWLLDMHRFLGTLSIIFTFVHLFGLFVDTYTKFGVVKLFVPMKSTYRPGAVAWGIVAFYLMVAVQITSWLMRKMPRKVWHTIHLTSFLLFVFATIHTFYAGADRGNIMVQWAAFTGVTIVLFLTVFRLLSPRKSRRAQASAPVPG